MNARRNSLAEGGNQYPVRAGKYALSSSALALIAMLCSPLGFAQQPTIPATNGPWQSGASSWLTKPCEKHATLEGSAQALFDRFTELDATASYTLEACVTNWPWGTIDSTSPSNTHCQPAPPIQTNSTNSWPYCTATKTSKVSGEPIGTIDVFPKRRVSCPAGQAFTTDSSFDLTGNYRCELVVEDDVCPIGNPFCPVSRTKFHEETDVVVLGGSGLAFRRYYNSGGYYSGLTALDRPAGLTDFWGHSFSSRIHVIEPGQFNYVAVRPDGKLWFFDSSGNESINTTSRGAASKLDHLPDGTWHLTLPNHDVEEYDSVGRLSRIVAREGIVISLSYDSLGQLLELTRFRGLFTVTDGGVCHGQEGNEIHAGVPATDRGFGARGASAGAAGA